MIGFFRAPGALLGALLLVGTWGAFLAGCSALEAAGGARPSPADSDAEPAPVSEKAGPGGTGWPAIAEESVRVGLVAGGASATVAGRGEFAVTVYSGAARRLACTAGEEWAFVGNEGGLAARSSRGAAFEFEKGTVRVAPTTPEPLLLNGTAYRGEIELYPTAPGSLAVVNVVGIESYLRGVVPGEIGVRPAADIEAVKAQAVAARTYAAASSGARGEGGFDVLATIEDQLYKGADSEDPVCDRAILETAGLVLTFDGRPVNAYFHSTCGGRTEARHEVWELDPAQYLTSVWDTRGGSRDLAEAWCAEAGAFTWSESWTGEEIEKFVRDELPNVASTPVHEPLGRVLDLEITARTPSGRARWLEIRTDGGTYRVYGDRARRFLRRPGSGGILRSAWFDIAVEKSGDAIVRVEAQGRGNGHGVGMCQHGALAMARAGRSLEEILAHYYPGTRLAQLRDVR